VSGEAQLGFTRADAGIFDTIDDDLRTQLNWRTCYTGSPGGRVLAVASF
jgi:hypothetical protein